jgi:hypothetical protein
MIVKLLKEKIQEKIRHIKRSRGSVEFWLREVEDALEEITKSRLEISGYLEDLTTLEEELERVKK